MLNIGRLDLKFRFWTATSSIDDYGQEVESFSSGNFFYARRVYKRFETNMDAAAYHGESMLELIIRFNSAVKLKTQIKGPIFSNDGGSGVYTITGIEELGRREGMKIYATRLVAQEDN
tara:strand:- start:188 stop:541 length:354 start_codon:yes stop_codon:yes gene_type:complete